MSDLTIALSLVVLSVFAFLGIGVVYQKDGTRRNNTNVYCKLFGHKRPSMNHMVASIQLWGMVQEQGNEHPVMIHCRRCGKVLSVIA